jgi:hypothetical protein
MSARTDGRREMRLQPFLITSILAVGLVVPATAQQSNSKPRTAICPYGACNMGPSSLIGQCRPHAVSRTIRIGPLRRHENASSRAFAGSWPPSIRDTVPAHPSGLNTDRPCCRGRSRAPHRRQLIPRITAVPGASRCRQPRATSRHRSLHQTSTGQ